jgi:hypothetical protein
MVPDPPEHPVNDVPVTLVYVTGFSSVVPITFTWIVPELGNPVVLTTLIVPVGNATPSEGTSTVVASNVGLPATKLVPDIVQVVTLDGVYTRIALS